MSVVEAPKYTLVSYGTARVYLSEGMYSLKDLRDLVEAMERLNKAAEVMLKVPA